MRAFLGCLALLLLLPECGGGSGASLDSPVDQADNSVATKRRAASAADTDDASDSSSGEERETSKGPSCDDGTCSLCGSGICPSGWYCDEKAGGSCSWLAECAEKPSCACITRVLGASCKCSASGGGLKVACD
jgi:hypothetical protein